MIRQSKIHAGLTLVWLALLIPTVIWWHSSILWLALISVYANVANHWGAWQASRAKESAERQEQNHDKAAEG